MMYFFFPEENILAAFKSLSSDSGIESPTQSTAQSIRSSSSGNLQPLLDAALHPLRFSLLQCSSAATGTRQSTCTL